MGVGKVGIPTVKSTLINKCKVRVLARQRQQGWDYPRAHAGRAVMAGARAALAACACKHHWGGAHWDGAAPIKVKA